MLIEFSVGNFRSFKEVTTLSMWAANLKSKDNPVYTENVFEATPKYTLLKSMALFGANASGKSNLVKAFFTFVGTVLHSTDNKDWLSEFIIPYSLSAETLEKPSFFEIVFIKDEVIYRYGFEATKKEIVSEWLYGRHTAQEAYYFTRSKKEVKIKNRLFNEAAPLVKNKLFHDYALLLSSVSAFNENGVASQISNYISEIGVISGIEDGGMNAAVNAFMQNDTNRAKTISLLTEADIAVQDVVPSFEKQKIHPKIKKLVEEGLLSLPEELSYKSHRNKYSTAGEAVGTFEADFEEFESEGTQHFFKLCAFILDTLEHGKLLVIDEFDARLHPKLSRKIVSLFNMPHTNPKNAQLIFTSHNVTLLDPYLLRRDQICFVEKDRYGASSLVNLAEFKGIRNNKSYADAYLEGLFGAIPLVENMESEIEFIVENKAEIKNAEKK